MPDAGVGSLTINGDLTLLSNSNIILNIAGLLVAGNDYDLLDVAGTINLDGTLTTLVDVTDYAAQLEDTFNPVTYSSSTGAFALVTNDQGFAYDIAYNLTSIDLVTTAIPGLVIPADPISEAVTFSENLDISDDKEDVTDVEEGIVAEESEDEEDDTAGQTMVCS
jgi:hypothetical protein